MTPQEFLSALDLHDQPTDSGWVDTKLRSGGFDPESVHSAGFSSELLNDAVFYDEEIARHTLNGNYKRILGSLTAFQTNLEAVRPCRVADLGGSVGLLPLFGAKLYPRITFTVYDQAQNPLSLGELWAGKLGVTTVQYKKASFEQISKEPPESDCDMVQLEYVLDFHTTAEAYLHSVTHDFDETHSGAVYDLPLSAVRAVIKENGTCVIRSGTFDLEKLEAFVDSARRNGFTISENTEVSAFGLTLLFGKVAELHTTRFHDIETLHSAIRRSMES